MYYTLDILGSSVFLSSLMQTELLIVKLFFFSLTYRIGMTFIFKIKYVNFNVNLSLEKGFMGIIQATYRETCLLFDNGK
jgi:hypothetical protein